MFTSASQAYGAFLVYWVGLARRAAWVVTAVSVLAVALVAVYVTGNFAINTNTDDMLSPELHFRKLAREAAKAFPQYSDNVVVVIDGDTPDLADDAALALAERIRRNPALFGDVHDLAGDPFFRQNGLLYEGIDELYELSDTLAEVQPFLGALWHDPTLRGLFRMMELAIDETLKEKGEGPIKLDTVLDAMARVVEAQGAGRFSRLSWQQLMRGGDGNDADPYRRFIVVQPALDFTSLQPAGKAIKALRRMAEEMKLDRQHGVRVRLTGSVALSQEELKSVEEGMGLAAVLTLVLVIGLLTIGLRSLRLVAATLITLIAGLIWTAGFAVAALDALNLISVAFAVLFIGLSVDFGIHFALRYKEDTDAGAGNRQALERAAAGVGGALTLCAATAAIGFYSFLPTDYRGLAELGLIAGTGMFIALFTNLTLLPALLTLMPPPISPGTGATMDGAAAKARRWIEGHARFITWGALAVGLAAASLTPFTRFDFDPLKLKDPKTESMRTLYDMMADDKRAGPYSLTILAADLEKAKTLAAELSSLDVVDETLTIADFVPADQEEKLDIIGTMALYLAPALESGEQKPPPKLEELADGVEGLRRRLGQLAQSDTSSAAAATRLDTALEQVLGNGPYDAGVLRELETRLLSSLPGRLDALRQSLKAGPVDLESLPRSLTERQIAADGRARIKVYPAEDLQDRAALRRFVEVVQARAPGAIGAPVIILEGGDAVVASFVQAVGVAVILISALLVVLLKGVREILLVFAPLTLAALLTNVSSILFDLPFNFANVIVLPLLFGLGVASSLHLVMRERDEGGGAMITSTPRAVVFSALTTIGSFGSIALSSHPGTSSMGSLLTIAIALTLFCTLVVLPALMTVIPPERETGS